MTKARDLADLGGVTTRLDEVGNTDGALSNRNVLINGNFSVSQRGDFTTASTWGSGYLSYSLDRWKIKRSSMTGTIQDLGNRVKVVATTPTGTDQMMIQQNIEDKNINHLAGKTVTLSALVKTNRSDCRVMYELSGDTGWMGRNVDVSNNEHSGGGSDERLTVTFSLPADMTGVAARVYVGFDTEDSVGNISLTAGDYFEAAEVQLEVGDTATPFEHRKYSDELQSCMRYFTKLGDGYQYTRFGSGLNWATGGIAANAIINLPVTLRAFPTLTTSGVFAIYHGNAVVSTASAIALETIGSSLSVVSLNVSTSGLTRGYFGTLIANNSTTAVLQFDAEL